MPNFPIEKEESGYLYRYDVARFGIGIDEDAPYQGYSLSIVLHKYKIVKETPCGVWIEQYFRHNKFVLSNSHKRFAFPTIKEASESFRRRKEKYVSLCKHDLEYAERSLHLANELWGKIND